MKNKKVLIGMAGMAVLSAEAIAQKPANIILINFGRCWKRRFLLSWSSWLSDSTY